MNKATISALVAFGVLLLAFVATREKEVAVGVQRFDATPIATSAIESITVTGASAAKLERGANGWTVADPAKADAKFPADDAQVQSVTAALGELKAPDFVSDKSEKHAEYEVTAEKGTTVVVSGGGKTLTFVLGKSSKSGGAYVRKPDGAAVFVTQSPAVWQLKRGVSAWRKKAIATASLADVTQVDVTRADGETYSMKLTGSTWSLASTAPAGFRFDASAGQRLAGALTSLTAQEFLSADGDFSKAHVFSLTTKEGKVVKVTLSATKRDDGNFALKVEGDPQQYVVAAWVAEQLGATLESLRDLSLMAFDPTKVTKVTLTAGGKKTVVSKDGEAWKLVEPKSAPEFDATQVAAQLSKLQGLRALKLAPEKTALGAASTTVELLVDGKAVRLVFGADSGGNVLVKGNADELVYETTSAEKTFWSGGAAVFKTPPPPPSFGNGNINGLDQLPPEIRKQLMEQLKQRGMN